ncbi:hypothetical protein ANN_09142 [Periplaneta americana]|uniref:DUF4817 domain-containing protein n=1 Tax=Periplaneta americana TaxID=6978 RepID=A0ABQ8TLZ8_PERAM|nr:hypothetical protein ANN_09142 [Periplaneta americana]
MVGLCEGGNKPAGSLTAICKTHFDIGCHARIPTRNTILRWVASFRITGSTLKKKSPGRNSIALRLSEATVRSRALRLLSLGPFEGFKVCHGSLYAVMWLADEPREFNLPTFPQRRITYVPEKLPGKYGVHSEEVQMLNRVKKCRPSKLVVQGKIIAIDESNSGAIAHNSVNPYLFADDVATQLAADTYSES